MSRCVRKLKLNERNIVIDGFERLVHYSEIDYSLSNSGRVVAADSRLRPCNLSCDRNLELII